MSGYGYAPAYSYKPQNVYYPPKYYPTKTYSTYQNNGDKIYSNVYPSHTTNYSRQGYVTNNYYPHTTDNVRYYDYVENNYYQNKIRDIPVYRYTQNNIQLPDIHVQAPPQYIYNKPNYYQGYGQLPFFNTGYNQGGYSPYAA